MGLVTATGGTLIANGVTTVHTTRVFGTYLNGGNYAQVVQSTAKVKYLNYSKNNSGCDKLFTKFHPYGAVVRPDIYYMSVLKCASSPRSQPM